MEILSDKTLAEAFVRCEDYEGYKVIIVFERLAKAIDFIKELAGTHRKSLIIGADALLTLGQYTAVIKFRNGSIIEAISISTLQGKRCRCNEVIYDDCIDIDDPELRFILQSRILPYSCEVHESTDDQPLTIRGKELDEFLNSFSIKE